MDLASSYLPEGSTVIAITLVALLVWYLVDRRQHQGGELVYSTLGLTQGSRVMTEISIPMLDQYNFKNWYFVLTTALEREGVVDAILRPYPEDHIVNRQAMSRILRAVPERYMVYLGQTLVAHQAVSNLRVKLASLSYTQLSNLEAEIKATKLKKFDNQSVSEHLSEIEKKIVYLQSGGAILDTGKHLGLLAETLPNSFDWLQFKDAIAYGSHSVDEALGKIKAKCRSLAEPNESAFITRVNSYRGDPSLEGKRARDISNQQCFYCHKTGHVISNCNERILSEVKRAKKYSNQYVSRPFASWVIDSAATKNYANSNQDLVEVRQVNNSSVVLADGSICRIFQAGDKFLHTGSCLLKLTNVHVAPSFEENLISVSQLTSNGYKVLFDNKEATVFKDNQVHLRARLINNLYRYIETSDQANCVNDAKWTVNKPDWHSKLGHPGADKMAALKKIFPELSWRHPEHCETCLRTKLHQLPYRTSEARQTEPLELIHTDLCGQMRKTGYDGSNHFIIFVDEYSKYVEVFLLKGKSSYEVLEAFKKFKVRIEKELDKRIKSVRSDNGGEFSGHFGEFLTKEGIHIQRSVPFCHQQNGTAERTIQKVVTIARSLMFDSCMPIRYWPLALKTAVYLANRWPHTSLDGQMPLKVLFPRKDDGIKKTHIFGSAAYRWIHHEKRLRSKFDPTSEKMVFVGYAPDADAYLLLNPETGDIIRERNVKIIDGVFPFCEKKGQGDECQCKVKEDCRSICIFPEDLFTQIDVIPSSGSVSSVSGMTPVPSTHITSVPFSDPQDCNSEKKEDQSQDNEVNCEGHSTDNQDDDDNSSVPQPATELSGVQQDQVELVTLDEIPDQPIEQCVPAKQKPSVGTSPQENSDSAPENCLDATESNEEPAKAEDEPSSIQSSGDQTVDPLGRPVNLTENESPSEESELPTLRRSSRVNKGIPPDRYGVAKLAHDLHQLKVKDIKIPTTYEEAMGDTLFVQYWQDATNDEIQSLMEHQVFDIVDEDSTKKPISTKWVFDVKRKANGVIDRFKARLVARGFCQKKGIDYEETFSPVVSFASIRSLLTIAGLKKLHVHQVDIKTAFLNGEIDKEIYVKPPPGYAEPKKVWKLNKSLYGLKQAPKCWFKTMNSIFAKMGFYPTKSERCIYTRQDGRKTSYLLVYVDDILIFADNPQTIEDIKTQLKKFLEMRDMGPIGRFLGVDFERSKDLEYLTMSQEMYITDMAERFGVSEAKFEKSLQSLENLDLADDPVDEAVPVRSIIGGLLYIANMTRPDISAAVSLLSRHLHRPTHRLFKYCKKVLNYLRGTKDKRLHLGNLDNTNLVAYVDANFAPKGDRKSQSGAVFRLGGSSVHWFSKKQKTVSTSTTEAEYIALAAATNEVLWIQNLLEELSIQVNYPTVIHEDNQPVVQVATNQKNNSMAKHIDTKLHALQDYILKGHIDVQWTSTRGQLADGLTKVTSSTRDADQLLGLASRHILSRECVEKSA